MKVFAPEQQQQQQRKSALVSMRRDLSFFVPFPLFTFDHQFLELRAVTAKAGWYRYTYYTVDSIEV